MPVVIWKTDDSFSFTNRHGIEIDHPGEKILKELRKFIDITVVAGTAHLKNNQLNKKQIESIVRDVEHEVHKEEPWYKDINPNYAYRSKVYDTPKEIVIKDKGRNQ